MLLGLSDHTPGHATTLGAVALGARIVEKHFTDDNSREGPDHAFSMNPVSWKEMVERTRELELALGNGVKQIERNEAESVVVQRRCLRFSRAHERGAMLTSSSLECLRPAPYGSLEPYRLAEVLGRRLNKTKDRGDALYPEDMIDSC
jgi:N-acetylneuraminate synthase